MSTTTANAGSKMEWDAFLKLYAKINRHTTTPRQDTLAFIFSPQDIRATIKAPQTHNYAPSTGSSCSGSSCSGVLTQFYQPSVTNSVPSTTLAWRPEGQDYYTPPSPTRSSRSSSRSSHSSRSSFSSSRSSSRSSSPRTTRTGFPPTPTKFSTHKRVYQKPAEVQGGVYLLKADQTRLLSKIQTLLEHACFRFAKQYLPHILIENEWACPEDGELNIWIYHLTIHGLNLLDYGITEPINNVLHSAKNIRHDAVHRNKVVVDTLAIYLDHAVALCTALEGQKDLYQVKAIRDFAKAEMGLLGAAANNADAVKTAGEAITDFINGLY
ncbi:hypothetical protein FPOA_08087 [Fusarium poae]|uniref:Uncharacterized protein n=1 Tax=Fusarium poae TaxID=36050 RepID=A0A1B8AMF6_FUSPO|nr:hypothetical protein FPOA_08087 [Fusarium poae]